MQKAVEINDEKTEMEKPLILDPDPDYDPGPCGFLLAYAFIYRGRNEPPAKRKVTNQEAAYYTLRGQIQMLSQKEELMALLHQMKSQ